MENPGIRGLPYVTINYALHGVLYQIQEAGMTATEAYQWLREHSRETAYLRSIQKLLAWDQRTCIPEKGHAHRTAQLAVLARLIHERDTDPRVGEHLSIVEDTEWTRDPESPEAVNIREWRRPACAGLLRKSGDGCAGC